MLFEEAVRAVRALDTFLGRTEEKKRPHPHHKAFSSLTQTPRFFLLLTGRAAVDGHPQDGQRPLPRHEPGGQAAERELGPRPPRCVWGLVLFLFFC
jgi:hypothetical protein